jgi:hypothetical protein
MIFDFSHGIKLPRIKEVTQRSTHSFSVSAAIKAAMNLVVIPAVLPSTSRLLAVIGFVVTKVEGKSSADLI